MTENAATDISTPANEAPPFVPASHCTFEGAATRPPAAEGVFVLVDSDAGQQTHWLENGPNGGRDLGVSEHVVLSWNGAEWRTVFASRRTGATVDCEGMNLEPGTSEGGTLLLKRLDGTGVPKTLKDLAPPSGVHDGTATSMVAGFLGSYVFLISNEYSYSCGAHGGESVEVNVVNLDGSPTPPLVPSGSLVDEARKQMRAYYDQMDMPEAKSRVEVTPAGALLSFQGGKPDLRYVFTGFTYYAASSWGSYQNAVFVHGPLPASLTRSTRIPTWLDSVRCGGKIVGVSPAPAQAAAGEAVRQAFHARASSDQ